jgi:tight adherence protein C
MLPAVAITSLTFGLVLYLVLANAQERIAVRGALRRLSEVEFDNSRQREMLAPLGSRALRPLIARLVALGHRATPAGYVAAARKKLILAGRTTTKSLDAFLAIRLVTAAAAPVVLGWFLLAKPLDGLLGMMALLLVLLVLCLGPDAVVTRWADERKTAIQRALPDTLDLLTISVEAGLGFDQALDRTVARVPGPLSEELVRMLGEMSAGIARVDSLRALDERTQVPELSSFVLSLIQADTFGISISRILRAQSDEMRIKRRQLAQERAQKAPVKMLFPMMLCIFPMIFVIVLGPAVINLSEQFIGK